MSFASPLWLLALLVPPAALLAQRVARRRARRYALRFTAVASVRAALATTTGAAWRRRVPVAALLLAVAALAVALARPQVRTTTAVRQAELVLVLDHSGSMQASDVKPTRLAAAERAANTFIDQLPASVRVGVVAFSSTPDTVLAPTLDRASVRAAIDSQVANGATATGDALADAISLLLHGGKRHGRAAIVLLSDGAANAGRNSVAVASQAARSDISIDTVALGTPGGQVVGPDPYAPPTPVPPDPQLMHQIAQASHGRFFTAQDADRLDSIYRGLGTALTSRATRQDLTPAFVGAGLALLLVAVLSALRWGARLP
jgi:Ca-activated chloride channel family protein